MSRADITKQALADTLIREIETKHLDRITVTDLTSACGISRQAFYYHFKDIYDLATWACEREARAALDEVHGYDYDTWQQGLLAILLLLRRRRDLVMRAIHAIDPTYVNRFLRHHVGNLVLHVVDEAAVDTHATSADKALVAQFYTAGLIDVVYLWFVDGMREEPSTLVGRVALLSRGSIAAALARLSEQPPGGQTPMHDNAS